MAITRITYFAADCSMGDTSPYGCEKFREWAEEKIASEYPDAAVKVVNAEGNNCAKTEDGYGDDQDCLAFLAGLWDACPWDFDC